jgi:hypothetical protein
MLTRGCCVAVVVGPSQLRDDAAETGFDWSPVICDDYAERDPLTGVALTEEQELYGDPWTELMATMSPEELDEWLGHLGAPTNTETSTADAPFSSASGAIEDRKSNTPRRSHGSLAENSDEDAWAGVQRIAPRPLPGVTGVAGPALAGALQHLDMSVLSPAQLVEAMTGAERLSRWAQSVQLAAVKAFADHAVITNEDGRDQPLEGLPGGSHTIETGFGTQREIEAFCADGIGAALGTSFTAGQQLIDAAYFTADVSRAAAMLSAGAIDVPRLKVMARELAPVGYQTTDHQQFVDQMVQDSAELTPRKLESRLRTAVMGRIPNGESETHRREVKNRSIWINRKQAGMASLCAYLTADEAQLAYQALNAHAWRIHDDSLKAGAACETTDGKSFDNFRADALMQVMRDLQTDLLTRKPGPAGSRCCSASVSGASTAAEDAEPGPTTRGRRMMDPARVMLHLYMQASTLAGLDHQPATLLGYGPIEANQARRLAEDAALTRILTDPFSGEIKAVDLASYRVPKVLRMAVQARDRSCVFPACDVPSFDTQIDHIDPHPFARRLEKALATGRTTLSNLQSLCLRHHYLKTHGGWMIQSTRGARLEWISPTGHSYRRNAEWGPPPDFWRDHDRQVAVDQPMPLPRPESPDTATCPF